MLIRVPHVGRQRRRLQRRELEIPVQHLVDRRGRPRVAPFVDLAGEPADRRVGVARRPSVRHDRLVKLQAMFPA